MSQRFTEDPTMPSSQSPPSAHLALDVWAAQVASFAELPDQRLNARLAGVLSVLGAKPEDSLPQAAGSWQKVKPIYRFLENKRVTVAHLLEPIARATAHACANQAVVYLVQDST